MDEIIKYFLNAFFDATNTQLQTTGQDILQTPATFFQPYWTDGTDPAKGMIMSACSMTIMPLAFTILAFCLAMDLVQTYQKHNGSVDIEIMTFTVLKYILPFLLIANAYSLMQAFTTIVNGFIATFSPQIEMTQIGKEQLIAYIMKNVSSKSIIGKFALSIELQILGMLSKIVGTIIYVIVVGRIFEMAMLWAVAPIPIAFLVNSEERQIGINFFKQFFALLLQGFFMILCLALYRIVATRGINQISWGDYAFWGVFGITIILAFALFKTGSLAKRIVNTF